MVDINTTIQIITLNVNVLNIPIKRHRLMKRIKKTEDYVVYKKFSLNINT